MLSAGTIVIASTGFQFFPDLSLLALTLLIAALLAAGFAVLTRMRFVEPPRLLARGLGDLVILLGPLVALSLTHLPSRTILPIWIVSAGLFRWAARTGEGWAARLAPFLAIVWFAIVSVFILRTTGAPHIDVYQSLVEGVRAQLHGVNPYAITTTNIYSAAENAEFYGPSFLVDGRVPFGFPYPPVLLLLAVPGYLLGDVRYTSVLLAALTALAVLGRGRDPRRRLVSMILIAAPGTWWMVTQAWTEVWIVALLAAVAIALTRGRLLLAAALVGALLVSKQYFVVALPVLWTLRPYATRGRVVVMTMTAATLTVPWFLAGPHAFIHSLIEYQTSTPMRFDSLGLLVELVKLTGGADSPAFRLLPVIAGLAVALVTARFAPRGAASFAAATCLSIFVAMLLSKQVFFNYYHLIACGFLIAAAMWHQPDREQISASTVGSGVAPAITPNPVSVSP